MESVLVSFPPSFRAARHEGGGISGFLCRSPLSHIPVFSNVPAPPCLLAFRNFHPQIPVGPSQTRSGPFGP